MHAQFYVFVVKQNSNKQFHMQNGHLLAEFEPFEIEFILWLR